MPFRLTGDEFTLTFAQSSFFTRYSHDFNLLYTGIDRLIEVTIVLAGRRISEDKHESGITFVHELCPGQSVEISLPRHSLGEQIPWEDMQIGVRGIRAISGAPYSQILSAQKGHAS